MLEVLNSMALCLSSTCEADSCVNNTSGENGGTAAVLVKKKHWGRRGKKPRQVLQVK